MVTRGQTASNGISPDGGDGRPWFLVTIDCEGDNLWTYPTKPTCRNAEFLPRFQSLCESYGLRPTYLATYEMACSGAFREFGRTLLAWRSGEIGMHLHAWDSPPEHDLTGNDSACHPYLIEYPPSVIEEKVRFLTGALEETFGAKMVSHRAGRWSFDAVYARILAEAGYGVDCSVTPLISWRHCKGDPRQQGGTDYRNYPQHAYFLDAEDISRQGDSDLLEVPVTVMQWTSTPIKRLKKLFADGSIAARALDRFSPPCDWLRPTGRNLAAMLKILDCALAEERDYVEFMLHSSELMPGGSPFFTTEAEVDRLYDHIEALFAAAAGRFRSATLAEYRQVVAARR